MRFLGGFECLTLVCEATNSYAAWQSPQNIAGRMYNRGIQFSQLSFYNGSESLKKV